MSTDPGQRDDPTAIIPTVGFTYVPTRQTIIMTARSPLLCLELHMRSQTLADVSLYAARLASHYDPKPNFTCARGATASKGCLPTTTHARPTGDENALSVPISSAGRSEGCAICDGKFVSSGSTPGELPSVQECADRFKARQEGDRRWLRDFEPPTTVAARTTRKLPTVQDSGNKEAAQ